MSGNWEHVGWHPARIGMCWVCNQLDSDRACRNYGNLASCVISSKFDKRPRGGGVSEKRKAERSLKSRERRNWDANLIFGTIRPEHLQGFCGSNSDFGTTWNLCLLFADRYYIIMANKIKERWYYHERRKETCEEV